MVDAATQVSVSVIREESLAAAVVAVESCLVAVIVVQMKFVVAVESCYDPWCDFSRIQWYLGFDYIYSVCVCARASIN